MNKTLVVSKKAPQAIGPYSQAVIIGEHVYLSGMLPIDPKNGELVEKEISSQTRQVLNNINNLLKDCSSSLENVIKTTIFLSDLNHFQTVNEIYGEYFGEVLPARSCIEVSRIPKDALIEIEVIAITKSNNK
ncbi:RidA family protein [Fictibacillus phosphorivorans]|uniref:RidA family protein n=1 Tax=Fictibacillus phosphorivorans TaxID=1221500 RepID=UPI00203FB63A|nr:RidA family protein [Fictibacillus phosphorivorans]MCM3718558.1 RidA family protein [Fictibacillus phosphorivorans]MCM3776086.1 RidA family protein [Fictibacillus phosphorivorans]